MLVPQPEIRGHSGTVMAELLKVLAQPLLASMLD
jgi:hypothetical protein